MRLDEMLTQPQHPVHTPHHGGSLGMGMGTLTRSDAMAPGGGAHLLQPDPSLYGDEGNDYESYNVDDDKAYYLSATDVMRLHKG